MFNKSATTWLEIPFWSRTIDKLNNNKRITSPPSARIFSCCSAGYYAARCTPFPARLCTASARVTCFRGAWPILDRFLRLFDSCADLSTKFFALCWYWWMAQAFWRYSSVSCCGSFLFLFWVFTYLIDFGLCTPPKLL